MTDALSCQLSLAVFFSVLAGAAYMDYRCQEVYDFFWVIACIPVMILFLQGKALSLGGWMELVLFLFIQQVFMEKVYGKADVHAFCLCAMIQTALGYGLQAFIALMAGTLIPLSLVQLVRKNVTRFGKLKKSVPMIPYIFASFFVWLMQ